MHALWLILALLLLVMLFGQRRDDGRRQAILDAAAIWGLLVTILTELLGLFSALTKLGCGTAWVSVDLVLLALLWRVRNRVRQERIVGPVLARPDQTWVLATFLIVAITGLIALVAAPNSWDGLTYHLGRVVHWVQNGHVGHYPTNNLRQLWMNPLAEYFILHFYLLADGDRLANLVQWLAMVASLIGVSLVAGQLGAGIRGQVFAAIFCATIPIGILEATGTQNDYVVAFWLIGFVNGLLRMIGAERRAEPQSHNVWWPRAMLTGTHLGLAALAKGTAYMYGLTFAGWLVVWVLWRRPKWAWRAGVIMAFVCGLLMAGFTIRNVNLFGSPFGPGSGEQLNGDLGVGTTVSNMTRNAALQMVTPGRTMNEHVHAWVVKLHDWFGLNVHDPNTSFNGQKFRLPTLMMHEDMCGNPLHFLLVLVAGTWIAARWRRLPGGTTLAYAVALGGAAILFSAFVRWQIWGSRLHLPLFVLASPLVGHCMDDMIRRRIGSDIVSAVLLACAVFPLFFSQTRPLLRPDAPSILTTPRIEHYAIPPLRPETFSKYRRRAEAVRQSGATQVGLVAVEDDYEYLMWVLLRYENETPMRIEHVEIENESASLYERPQFKSFQPQVKVRLRESVVDKGD